MKARFVMSCRFSDEIPIDNWVTQNDVLAVTQFKIFFSAMQTYWGVLLEFKTTEKVPSL